MVHQHADGRDDDAQIAPDRPLGDIFQVRLEPVYQLLTMVGRSAIAAHLRQPGPARLDAWLLPIALVHFSIVAVACLMVSVSAAWAHDPDFFLLPLEKIHQLHIT